MFLKHALRLPCQWLIQVSALVGPSCAANHFQILHLLPILLGLIFDKSTYFSNLHMKRCTSWAGKMRNRIPFPFEFAQRPQIHPTAGSTTSLIPLPWQAVYLPWVFLEGLKRLLRLPVRELLLHGFPERFSIRMKRGVWPGLFFPNSHYSSTFQHAFIGGGWDRNTFPGVMG